MKIKRESIPAISPRCFTLKVLLVTFIWIVFVNLSGQLKAYAQAIPQGCNVISLPEAIAAGFQPQWIIVCTPQVWNGDLVVYAHSYRPPQVPVDSPENLALLLQELSLSDGSTVPGVLLPLGYAFFTTTFHKNGYAIEQGAEDLNGLVAYFKASIAPTIQPHRVDNVFVAGGSEGGLIATMLVESDPDTYNGGGLSLAGPVGGAAYQIKYLADFRVVFDYFFPQIFKNPPVGSGLPAFGAFDVPPQAVALWDTVYVPAITTAIKSNPGATRQLFRVTHAAQNPLDPVNSAVATSTSILFYSIWGSNDLMATAGGIPYDNRFTLYLGSDNFLALNKGVERVHSTGSAPTYVNQFYRTTGHLERPLVTLHTTLDPIVPFAHELIYAGRATLAGTLPFLSVLPVVRYGHANFTSQEILGAFGLLVQKAGQLSSH